MSEAILGNNLVTLGSLSTARSSKDPDNGQARGGKGRAVDGLELKMLEVNFMQLCYYITIAGSCRQEVWCQVARI